VRSVEGKLTIVKPKTPSPAAKQKRPAASKKGASKKRPATKLPAKPGASSIAHEANLPAQNATSEARTRCAWCGGDPLYITYHDEEWGVPVRDERKLFEMLLLEGFQAGLSWITILRKRENFRRAFHNFEPELIARFTPAHLARLMQNAGIVRNRLKIAGTVASARAFLEIRDELGAFERFIWQFTDNQILRYPPGGPVRATSPESDRMSKELKRRGFKFVGSTICYAFMQAVGMVDDHAPGCWKYSAKNSSL
jgi:DNA-3-methyladenine glycosylase I